MGKGWTYGDEKSPFEDPRGTPDPADRAEVPEVEDPPLLLAGEVDPPAGLCGVLWSKTTIFIFGITKA